MHLIAFLLAAAVAVVNAEKPCCAPEQFMSGFGMVWSATDPRHGTRSGQIYSYGAHDFTSLRFGFQVMSTNGYRTSHTRVIKKFVQETEWIIMDEYQYCEKRRLPAREPSNCLRDNGTYTGSAIIGGPYGVAVDNWEYEYHSYSEYARETLFLSVTQDSCFPVGKIFTGKRSIRQGKEISWMNSGGTMNTTIGISDPDRWFTVPPYCEDESIDMSARRPVEIPSLEFLDSLFY